MARTLTERAHAAVEDFQGNPVRIADRVFSIFGTLASAWLAFLLVHQLVTAGWRHLWAFFPFWLIVTYLLLPRIHSVLSKIYLPDYYIGRSRTREGLLGDPVNLGLRAGEQQVHVAMVNAGWHRADELNLLSSWRLVASTLLDRSYPDAPVSPLFLFGRRQTFTYQQEVEGNPAQRHHVRFWPCPQGWRLPGGHQADWLAAGTYDKALGLSLFTFQVTHRIEAEIDTERDHIVATLTAPEARNTGIRVQHLRNFSTGYHHRNGGGDSIRTDGDLPIVDVRDLPLPSEEVEAVIHADQADAARRRPIPLTVAFGILLMVARVAAGVVSLSWVLAHGEEVIAELQIVRPLLESGFSTADLMVVIRSVIIGYLVTYLVLAIFVYRSHNWARMVTLTISAISILMWAALWLSDAAETTLVLNLLGTALEILVLLALSSETARVFSNLGRRAAQATSDGV